MGNNMKSQIFRMIYGLLLLAECISLQGSYSSKFSYGTAPMYLHSGRDVDKKRIASLTRRISQLNNFPELQIVVNYLANNKDMVKQEIKGIAAAVQKIIPCIIKRESGFICSSIQQYNLQNYVLSIQRNFAPIEKYNERFTSAQKAKHALLGFYGGVFYSELHKNIELALHSKITMIFSRIQNDLINPKDPLHELQRALCDYCSFPATIATLTFAYLPDLYDSYVPSLLTRLCHEKNELTSRTDEIVALLQEVNCPEQIEHWSKCRDDSLKRINNTITHWSRISFAPFIEQASQLRNFEDLELILGQLVNKASHFDVKTLLGCKVALSKSIPALVEYMAGSSPNVGLNDYIAFITIRRDRLDQYLARYFGEKRLLHKRLGFDIFSLVNLLNARVKQESARRVESLFVAALESTDCSLEDEQSRTMIRDKVKQVFNCIAHTSIKFDQSLDMHTIRARQREIIQIYIENKRKSVVMSTLDQEGQNHAHNFLNSLHSIMNEALPND
jgi:hypothetical protein